MSSRAWGGPKLQTGTWPALYQGPMSLTTGLAGKDHQYAVCRAGASPAEMLSRLSAL